MMGELLYSEYTQENPTIVGLNGGIKRRLRSDIRREKFISISNTAYGEGLPISKGRDACEREMLNRVSGSLGFIEYFLLKAIIMWIIRKILDWKFPT